MFSPAIQELESPVNEDAEKMELSPEAARLRQTILDFLVHEQKAVRQKKQAKPNWFLLARRTGENADTFTTEGGWGDFDEQTVDEVLSSFGVDRMQDIEYQEEPTEHELQWQTLNSNKPDIDIRVMKGQTLDPATNQYHHIESYRFGTH